MATPGPKAAATTPVKPKKELTEDQKKTYKLLAVMGVLAVITAGIYVPPMLSGSGPDLPQAPTTETADPAAATDATPPADPAAAATEAAAGAPTEGAAPAAAEDTATAAPGPAPVARYRQDPMQPFYTEAVSADPTPTPIPPVIIPEPRPQIALPQLRNEAGPSMALVALPPPRIPGLNRVATGPQVSSAPRRQLGGTTSGGDPVAAYNKRLSGVMIGDGVRALLEINNGDTIVTRVVQPGDEVDGITVLSIQRLAEGNRTITRMTIREDGEERFVDLKAAPMAPANAAAGGLAQ